MKNIFKKSLTALVMMAIAVSCFQLALAETKATSTKDIPKGQLKKDIEDQKNETKNINQGIGSSTKVGSTTKANDDAQKERIRVQIELNMQRVVKKAILNTVRRYEVAILRIEKLETRTESRVAKFKAAGADTSEAEALIPGVKAKIASARASLNLATTTIDALRTATTTKKIYNQELKPNFVAAKQSIKDAHQALVKVINVLKGIKVKIEGEHATTTTPTGAATTSTATTTNN